MSKEHLQIKIIGLPDDYQRGDNLIKQPESKGEYYYYTACEVEENGDRIAYLKQIGPIAFDRSQSDKFYFQKIEGIDNTLSKSETFHNFEECVKKEQKKEEKTKQDIERIKKKNRIKKIKKYKNNNDLKGHCNFDSMEAAIKEE